jgi:hypothetical protein
MGSVSLFLSHYGVWRRIRGKDRGIWMSRKLKREVWIVFYDRRVSLFLLVAN